MQQHLLRFAALKFHQLSTLVFSLTPPYASHPLLHADLAINSELRAQEDGWATCTFHHTPASTIWQPKEDNALRCLHASSLPPLACLALFSLLCRFFTKFKNTKARGASASVPTCNSAKYSSHLDALSSRRGIHAGGILKICILPERSSNRGLVQHNSVRDKKKNHS